MDFVSEQMEQEMDRELSTISEPQGPENTEGFQTETKAEKFKRLASARVNKAGDAIELLGNLSSNSYEYTEEDVEKIFGFLQKKLDETKEKFTKTSTEKEVFSF